MRGDNHQLGSDSAWGVNAFSKDRLAYPARSLEPTING